jgi:16S rRNA processing protein RimM
LSDEQHRWVAIARILGPRGNKGEVAVELLTDFPERLAKIRTVYLRKPEDDCQPLAMEVASFWISKNHVGQAVYQFKSIDSISAAEALRRRIVLLPIEKRVQLPSGMYFISDLIGCSVFEHAEPESAYASGPCSLATAPSAIGQVSDVEFTGEDQPGTPLLHVDTPQGELLIPLAEDICFRIDTQARRIDVHLPEGLRDLQ